MIGKKNKGFTLIEVLITIAIVGILTSIAYPSYTQYVIQSNRAEPQRELLELANLMEQHFIDHRTYTNDLSLLGRSASSYTTESGNYTMSATIAGGGNTYSINATVVSGSSQASDSECLSMSVDETGKKTATNASCWEK